jgi:uncharacterized protein YjbJ (UPF0337 family)
LPVTPRYREGGPKLAKSKSRWTSTTSGDPPPRRIAMGIGEHGDKNVVKGVGHQVEGKVNEVAGAVTGDLGQELKGKTEKNLGKLQETLGRTEEKAAE